MAGKKGIIRTLEICDDKKVDYLGMPRPEILKTQLRALYRASV